MPAIRGIYYEHPQTSEPGIWIWCTWGDVVGFSQTELDSIRLTGNPSMRTQQFKSFLESELQAACERRETLIGWTLQELQDKAANPPPYTDVDVGASERVIQPFVITITPIELEPPRRLQIEVSDGAYTSNTRYG